MNWIIYKNDDPINTIYADEDFIEVYCKKNGYTYKLREDSEPVKTEPTTEERLAAVEQAILSFMISDALPISEGDVNHV